MEYGASTLCCCTIFCLDTSHILAVSCEKVMNLHDNGNWRIARVDSPVILSLLKTFSFLPYVTSSSHGVTNLVIPEPAAQ